MRITHLIASMDPSQGGPPVVVQQLGQAQANAGQNVTIASPQLVLLNDPNAANKPLAYVKLAHARFSFTGGYRDLPPADVLHLHGVWEPVLLRAAREAKQRGTPYLVAPHGMLDPWSLAQKRWKKRFALLLGYRRMLNRASALHLLNDDESRLIDPLRLTAPRVVIPNGIARADLEITPDLARFRQHPQGPGEQPYILFLSRLHYKKGLDYLAEAFARIAPRHPGLLLVVVGPDGGAAESFRNQVHQLGLTARVRLPGPLFGADKWSAIAGARVFCLPSRQEGFSVAILEAMACRTPVVISEACHFPEVATAGAGQVVPLNSEAVAGALDAVLSDEPQAKAMGEAGRQLVQERFTWPAVAARTIEIYDRLVNRLPVS
jgi:glycosyltransferase involved in cell wall biosynthesis